MENEVIEKEKNTKFDPKAMGLDFAAKLDILFKLKIITVIVAGLTMIAFVINTANPFTSDFYIELVLGIVVLVLNLAFSVVLIKLAKYHDGFNIAGVLYIFYAIVSFLKAISDDGSKVLSLVNAVLDFLYLLKFSSIMIEIYTQVDLALKDSWRSYRKGYICVIAIIFGCAVLAFVPLISGLAGLLLVFAVIASIVLAIWEFILLYKSAKSMRAFVSKSDDIPFPAQIHSDWEEEFRSTQNNKDDKDDKTE